MNETIENRLLFQSANLIENEEKMIVLKYLY